VGYALYTLYQDDQDERHDEQEARAAADAAEPDSAAGALTPIGEQAAVSEGLGDVNSGPVAGGGVAQQAINDAQQAVDQANGAAGASGTIAVSDVLPPEIADLATELQPMDGLTRYIVDVDHAALVEPLSTPGWLTYLLNLPQVPENDAGLSVLPAVGPGEVALAVQTEGDRVTRLVVLGVRPEIRIDQ
jgi:hypothetical protein